MGLPVPMAHMSLDVLLSDWWRNGYTGNWSLFKPGVVQGQRLGEALRNHKPVLSRAAETPPHFGSSCPVLFCVAKKSEQLSPPDNIGRTGIIFERERGLV